MYTKLKHNIYVEVCILFIQQFYEKKLPTYLLKILSTFYTNMFKDYHIKE